MKMSKVMSCNEKACAYNQNEKCHAIAITVGDAMRPCCDTELPSEKKGGIQNLTGGVGACKVGGCQFNQSFECAAKGIEVSMSSGRAECHTFKAR